MLKLKLIFKEHPVVMKTATGLAAYYKKRHSDTEGFFRFCMASELMQEYDEETRASVWARTHKEAFGKWPAEDVVKRE